MGRAWSQREASERAGLSDRLIRKAERGGPLELKTIALLAQLYSQPGAPVNPQTLLADRLEHANEPSAIYEPLMRRWWQERIDMVDIRDSSTYWVILEEGMAEGEARGRAEGRAEGLRAMLLEFAARRLGSPTADVQASLDAVNDTARLHRMGQRVLDVATWQDLLATT